MVEQVIIIDPKKADLKEDKLKEEKQREALAKFLEKLPDIMPYIGVFAYGFIVGYAIDAKFAPDSKKLQTGLLGGARVGAEALMFFQLAKGLPSDGVAPNPAQLFGIAGLTSIGLALPTAELASMATQAIKNFPWIYKDVQSAPLGGIDLKPVIKYLQETWNDFLKAIGAITD